MMEIDRKTTGIHKITQLNSRGHGSAQLRGARRRVTMCTRAVRRPSERWPSGRRHQIANLAYWVTGTEGSNPSLSANQSRWAEISYPSREFCPDFRHISLRGVVDWTSCRRKGVIHG